MAIDVQLQAARANPPYPPGIELLQAGECPMGQSHPMACWFCQVGHATECHHPMDCETANCSHYQQARALEDESCGN